MPGTVITREPRPTSPGKKSPMPLGSTTCTAMLRNGYRTAFNLATSRLQRMAPRGLKVIAVPGCFAAVPGSAVRDISAPPTATAATPTTGMTLSVFGSGGRLLFLESLPLCLLGFGGRAPNGFFWRIQYGGPRETHRPGDRVALSVSGVARADDREAPKEPQVHHRRPYFNHRPR